MPRSESDISWFPAWSEAVPLRELRLRTEASRGAEWTCRRPSDGDWRPIANGLRIAARALRDMPIAAIVDTIDRVAADWSARDFPTRIAAREAVMRATGFSAEAVDESFDVELRNYRAESLWRALRRELGDPRMLDAFVSDPQLGGSVRALGPCITLVVCTGNVPALPALPLVRALLVKSAVIAKVASGEPSFARHFVESLHATAPRLAEAIVVTYWARHEDATLAAVVEHTDAVIAYGSDEACRQIRAAVSARQRFVEHGHKLSVGVLSSAFIARRGARAAAERVARDMSVFNQHACIAPQAYFVQGDAAAQRAFADALAGALRRHTARCPLGTLEPDDAAAMQLERAAHAWRGAAGAERALWRDDQLQWTLTLEPALDGARGLGNRFLRLIGIEELDQVVEQLRPYGSYLQNVGLGVEDHELGPLASALAQLGASRLCEPGRMAEPSMMWRHDGRLCIAELLRFCDIEMHGSSAAIGADGMQAKEER